jgi:hypothetical protein
LCPFIWASSTWRLGLRCLSFRFFHYYKNDFMRHCININRGDHKIQQSRKMLEDFRRWTFLFTEMVIINRLANCIYGAEHFIYKCGQNCPS